MVHAEEIQLRSLLIRLTGCASRTKGERINIRQELGPNQDPALTLLRGERTIEFNTRCLIRMKISGWDQGRIDAWVAELMDAEVA